MNKRGQIWGADVFIAIIIFSIGIIGFFLYSINFTSEADLELNTMNEQGNLATSLILSEGTPSSWTDSSFQIPGILTENKVNETKLGYIQAANYDELKLSLGLEYEIYVILGEETFGLEQSDTKNLVRIERFTVYQNRPTKMVTYIWN